MNQSLTIIGEIRSELNRKEDCPLQESEGAPGAVLNIYPGFIEGITDIKVGSKIMLLTWLHLADRSVTRCIRRNEYHSPPVGVFSTRSPDRPNPIGIHIVDVISITNDTINVSALEVLDKTPLIDIKPL